MVELLDLLGEAKPQHDQVQAGEERGVGADRVRLLPVPSQTKTTKRSTKKAPKGTSGEGMSLSDLSASELAREMQKRARKLQRKRDRLQSQLEDVESQIAELQGAEPGGRRG